MTDRKRETDLYPALKAYLEKQGYRVKAEIAGADIVARRGDEPPVIVEMKTGFSLTLFHQGIARLAISDHVYLAVPRGPTKAFRRNVALARRLGLGVLAVRLCDGHVEPVCDPGPYAARRSKPKTARLLREFDRRAGDPNTGGHRGQIVTAYRQDCRRIAACLAANGAMKGAAVARQTAVPAATRIMRENHYGWFEKVATGIYRISDRGRAALAGEDPHCPPRLGSG